MAHRKAASVLPDPVGAETSACRPDPIASQAPVCAAVGAANAEANQDRVAGEKRASTGCSVATTTEEHDQPAQASPHPGTQDRGTIYTPITDLQRVTARFGACFRVFSRCEGLAHEMLCMQIAIATREEERGMDRRTESGRIGYLVLYLMGVPIGVLILLWVLLGNNLIGPG